MDVSSVISVDKLRKNRVLAILGLCIILFVLSAGSAFTSRSNIVNILRQVSVIGIISSGLTLVVIAGGIDLSAGSVVALSAIAVTLPVSRGVHPFLAFCLALATGALSGLWNGALVAYVGLPPFIATLGSMMFLRGLGLMICGGMNIEVGNRLPPWFSMLGKGFVGILPISVIVFMLAVLVSWALLDRTVFGRRVYAVGANERAAAISGTNVRLVRLLTYVYCGLMASLAAIVLVPRLGVSTANLAEGYELSCLLAVVLGGTSMLGGEGSVPRTLAGTMLIGVIENGLALVGIPYSYRIVVEGLVFIFAVAADVRKGND